MRVFGYTLLVLTLCLLQSCSRTDLYNQKTKTLDSLNGALNLKVKELQKTDTALLQRCILRYNYYRQFVKQNINDTLTKTEADNLQRFYESGNNLEAFWSNRFALLGRAALMNGQQNKLSDDIKSELVDLPELEKFIEREKAATTQLIDLAASQQKSYYTALEEFKNALREVENLIRARNKGELPTIVRDTLAL
ncbi:MAG: hypothetical protein IT236_16470 [Bacteroidia bacterium]|nr:hypothetical protein [Bacteroidia bacterium]